MTRSEASSRFSSITSTSSDSARSSITVKPLPATPTPGHSSVPGNNALRSTSRTSSRRAVPTRLKPDEDGNFVRSFKESESQIDPKANSGTRLALSPSSTSSNVSLFEHRMSDFANYRRDLAILDPAGGRSSSDRNPINNPASGSLGQVSQVAPWMAHNGGNTTTPAGGNAMSTSFFNNSSDNLSSASQMSPELGQRNASTSTTQTPATRTTDWSENTYFPGDERRPSIASIATTASSQGSKTSVPRGNYQKMKAFFGEDFPGRDSSESSLTHPGTGKEHRSQSYGQSRPHRDRNYSNATDHTRDASPSSSRPRTPVPAPEVVPFLYQEADDIARYGEAPVRDILSGPDRDRYVNDNLSQYPPKTSSSSRSGHSIVHLPGHHHHRHKNSNDDPSALRPSISREESATNYAKERAGSSAMSSTLYSSRSRGQSPTPSGSSYKNGSHDGQTSPGHVKKGILGRLRRNKDKDRDASALDTLRKLPTSAHSLQPRPSRADFSHDFSQIYGSEAPDAQENRDAQNLRPNYPRATTFNNKLGNPFSTKKSRANRINEDDYEQIGPTDRQDNGKFFHLDTNLQDMDGILSRPLPQTPNDADFILMQNKETEALVRASVQNGAWNAPDSWAVRRSDEPSTQVPEPDDIGSPPRPEEKANPYCIRVFRSDGTFATLQLPLETTVSELIQQMAKKQYVKDPEIYRIVLKKHDLVRILNSTERPLLMQKRLLEQVGYEERDRLEDLGREDNSYICRFFFLSERECDVHTFTHDLGFVARMAKFSHVDLSTRNLTIIPVSLYSKASDIISLNLSRNLSLDLPRDFIQSCLHLRDIKFNNNEARKLPPSLSAALKLTYLDVSNNRLEQLEHADLGGLTGLLKLNLANNRLKHLPSYFGAYRALRTLNISSNFLDQFPSFLCDLESLVDLDLSFNLISSFPEEIGNLRNLEKFVITNNRLEGVLPDSIRHLTSLRELDIKYNNISGIEITTLLPKLEILTADHNSVSQFIGSFERLRSLKLNGCPITKFEITSQVLTLKVLNLSEANLGSIDESFNHMSNLERLVLDKNYFVSLPAQIGNLRRLEHFSIASNALSELPVEIGCLTELRVLDVHGNNIRKLPMELWWANKLEVLNASTNVIESFPKPASRAPQPPGEVSSSSSPLNGSRGINGSLSQNTSAEELNPDGSRRPSQASSSLLSVGPSPVPGGTARVAMYGKGGRKTSVVSSRSATQPAPGNVTPSITSRKDSGLTHRMSSTFAGSLRHLYLADNQLDDDVFDQLMMLTELRVLNLSYNALSDMPHRSIKSWPQLVELYLSGNDLTSLPAEDLDDYSVLQVLHINGNKFQNLPADISRATKLAVLDCGNNVLKYNISNVPYDWNWNLNPNLRYLNLSGNRRLEIKAKEDGPSAANREQFSDFNRLSNLRVLGLMDVTLTKPQIPDQNEDRRVRTSGSMAGYVPYGMADTMGKNEHLSTIDLVVPKYNAADTELLLGLFDGQALSSGGSKIAKYLHEHFGKILSHELKTLKSTKELKETPEDALRRAFISLNKDLVMAATQHTEERALGAHRPSVPIVLSKEDLNSGGVATVAYLNGQELYVANVGDIQAMLIQSDGSHKFLTRKHDPAEPGERSRIRDAGGWVSRNGRLNDLLDVSRAFGYVELMPAVQAAPHVTHVTVKDQDETVLLATKELWDHLPHGLVVDIARAERTDLMRAAQKLRDTAISYGATNKIMVMMISVSDLKRRSERIRLHRGQSLSWYPGHMLHDESQSPLSARRANKLKAEGPLDSTLSKLPAEVAAPTGLIAIVFTDIKNSTNLWDVYPSAMRGAIRLHNEALRRQLRRIGGFEVKTEGDAFMVSFPTATSALLWCFAVQIQLLQINWPSEMLNSVHCQPDWDKDNNLVFKGLSVRMGIHWGEPLAEPDPVTRRMDYYGPMVNKASRISAVADGGQIAVSSDFLVEIQRCLETYQETSAVPDDNFEEDVLAKAIRTELRSLSTQGFEVKEMGERKLKGLENPEIVYSLYPHALAGRIDRHNANERPQPIGPEVENQPAILSPGSELALDPEAIWALWKVSLRLEMLCSTLEEASGRGLQPPETELLDRMKQRGGEVTERFLVNFMEHQISRIETCVSTLSIRHIARGSGPIAKLSDLRAPISDVLDSVAAQLRELEHYKQRFGEIERIEEIDDGSDTEQEY